MNTHSTQQSFGQLIPDRRAEARTLYSWTITSEHPAVRDQLSYGKRISPAGHSNAISNTTDLGSVSPVPPLSSIGTWRRTRIATIHEKLGTLTN